MPYYRNYRYRRWRRRRNNYWRPRKAFRPRFRRRRWVRRPYYYKKKLKKLKITEWQPKSIRKCKVKGMLCLFETTLSRASYNYDMYEESFVPEKLPGGGGFSIKNLSLYSLYQEHTIGHNIFTHTNKDHPLMRYTGCTIKLYQSENTDYVCTYSNTWPLKSTMAMYNTMQPSMHLMQKNKILIPSKRTQKRKRPYTKKFIPPPTQMKNQWYFQKTLSKVPLFMIRTSAVSLDHYYIGTRNESTNITIHTLNTSIIQNRDFGKRTTTYWCQQLGTQRLFLYATHSNYKAITDIKLTELLPLTNTQDNTEGQTYEEWKRQNNTTKKYNDYFTEGYKVAGNPFHTEYLSGHTPVLTSPTSWTQINEKLKTSEETKITADLSFSEVELTINVRYNPYKDDGSHNSCYFLPVNTTGHGWDRPGREEIENYNLPLWLLLWGFSDFVKKTEIIHNVDTQYILVINTNKTNPPKQPLVPISNSFYEGNSPYEQTPNKIDYNRWYPTYQYQQEAINNICLTGPGTPKIAPTDTVEAKIKYTFHFKWGGDPAPMSTVSDPTEQPWYPIPNNNNSTNSLQNPETAPEKVLYSFDERRGQLTRSATERMQKDWETKETSLLPTEYKFAEKTALQETQEISSEEEAENLFQLLDQQRLKQKHLRHRIRKTLKEIQQLQ